MKKVVIYYLLILFISCSTDDCPTKFQIPAYIQPLISNYKIGDTLTINSKFYKVLQEANLNEEFNFEKHPPRVACGIYKIDTQHLTDISIINKYIQFIYNDSILANIKYLSGGQNVITGVFNYNKDSFYTEIKIKLNTLGIYLINFGSDNYDEPFPGQCKFHEIYDIFTMMNNNRENNNLEFLKESPDSFYSQWMLEDPVNRFHRFGGYCFKVVP